MWSAASSWSNERSRLRNSRRPVSPSALGPNSPTASSCTPRAPMRAATTNDWAKRKARGFDDDPDFQRLHGEFGEAFGGTRL